MRLRPSTSSIYNTSTRRAIPVWYGAVLGWWRTACLFDLCFWWAIPSGTRAKAIGLWHGLGNVVVVALFAVSWWMRSASLDLTPSPDPGRR